MDALNVGTRQGRGFAIYQAKGSKIREVIQGKYLVPSQTQPSGSYLVDAASRSCTCPDWETLGGHGREHTCKHIYAVLIVRREVPMPDGSSVIVTEEQHVTYPQPKHYKKARMFEKELVMQLLAGLCATVPQPPYKGDGRPALPLGDVIFTGALKVYSTFSGDRAMSDVRWAKEKGLITKVVQADEGMLVALTVGGRSRSHCQRLRDNLCLDPQTSRP
jgi:hypothetical protein